MAGEELVGTVDPGLRDALEPRPEGEQLAPARPADGVRHSRARDGYCQAVTYSRAQWQSLVEWMAAEGMAGDLADPRWLDPALRLQYRERIHDLIEEFSARFSRQRSTCRSSSA